LVKSWGSKKGGRNLQKPQKPEKRSKNPPAKTPYDAKSGCLIALTTFFECFSRFPVFGGVLFLGFWGFPDEWALPVASCLCRAYTMPTHYNIPRQVINSDVYSSLFNYCLSDFLSFVRCYCLFLCFFVLDLYKTLSRG